MTPNTAPRYTCLFFLFSFLLITHTSLAAWDTDRLLYPEEEGKRISMKFDGVELNQVLKIFSEQSGLNYIASSDVGSLTIDVYLDDVPIKEAMEQILEANNLSYKIKPGSNIFYIKDRPLIDDDIELITRIYKLQYISLPSSRLKSTLSDFEEGASESEINEQGIVDIVKSIISSEGSVVEDTRTNSLIVTDFPGRFSIIEQAIQSLDIKVPLILIEAEMLDISKDATEELGTKFNSSVVTFSGGSRQDFFPFDFKNILTDNLADAERTVPGARDGFAFFDDNQRFQPSLLDFGGLGFTINFLRSHTDTKSLARPRILTLNNQPAEIFIKTTEAIGIASSVTGADAGQEATVEAEREDTGVFLTVTPQANVRTGDIILAIQPKVIEANTTSTFSTASGTQTFRNPETRGTKSILRVKDGDTIVLGGLLTTESIDTRSGVPFLDRIPILGAAFRDKNLTEDERELVVFITSQIVQEDDKTLTASSGSSYRNLVREQGPVSQTRQETIANNLSYFER